MSDTQTIHYEQVAYMEPVTARDGKKYLTLGKVTNAGIENTMAVTPADGHGETKFFCLIHEEAYNPSKGFCLGCRMQVREEPKE